MLIDSNKNELYRISYSDVWDIHEERGDNDSVTINIYKLPANEITKLIDKYGIQSSKATVKSLLNNNTKGSYKLEIERKEFNEEDYDFIINRD